MGIPQGGIAFFDSGIGGMTVLLTCMRFLPNEQFYYFGDNTHAPYGNRSEKQICRYVFRAFRRFQRLKVRAVVLACNTATAICVERLRKKFSFPIIGAEPAVRVAAKEGGEIFVLTTRATHNSARFVKLCENTKIKYPNANVRTFACDGLAGAIEKNFFKEKSYSEFFPAGKPNAIVLGCTHYIYVKEQIEKFYGCRVYDGNEGIAHQLKKLIRKNTQTAEPDPRKKEQFSKKSRDEQPPNEKSREKYPFLTTENKKKAKANKRSRAKKQNRKKWGKYGVIFLGFRKKSNKMTFEKLIKNGFFSQKGQ